MAHVLTTPVPAPSGSPIRTRGVLAIASPAPEGWENGGLTISLACPTPIVRDKCVSMTDQATRPTISEFPAFLIEQGSGCSTLSGDAREREAREALNQSTDYALGRTLATGEANNAPNLSQARNLGKFVTATLAIAALECAAAEAGKGSYWVIHATPRSAAHLRAEQMMDDGGYTPSGAPIIVSTGYGCEDKIWATGRVWAAAGSIDSYEAVDRATNNREAWAVRSAIVGFNPCINLVAEIGEPAPKATGATAGEPGVFTPEGSEAPFDLAELKASDIKADPATAWSATQYVVLRDGSKATWNGAEWIAFVPKATGATAGTPGSFTPEGALPPKTIAEMTSMGIKATPATAWADDQYVVVGNGDKATWDGTKWVQFVPSVVPNTPQRSGNFVTVPVTEGVDYYLDGEGPMEGGIQHKIPTDGQLVFTAKAKAGYKIKDGAVTSWTFKYEA